jgi:ribosomal protein S18 acetylase RimI-like enzyme
LASPVAEADVRALAGLLVDAVESGAAVSFLAPLSAAEAEAWWRGVVATLERDGDADRSTDLCRAKGRWHGPMVLVARDGGGEIVGTVTLQPAWAPNQPHRAEVCKLIVHRRARGGGLGERLMLAAEDAARAAGFTLLTLDARAGGAAERLYRRMGWTAAGTIPRYALDPDGRGMHDAVYFYKELGGGGPEQRGGGAETQG